MGARGSRFNTFIHVTIEKHMMTDEGAQRLTIGKLTLVELAVGS